MTTPYSRFNHYATLTPDNPAIIDEQSCVTYSGLDRMVDTLISRFPSFIPARVGVVMDHSFEMVAALLAINKAGAAFVPVEPGFPPERLAQFLTENGVDFVITRECYSSLVRGFDLLIVNQALCSDPVTHPLPDRSRADRPAYILYTTSPSGYPAGVMVGNSQTVALAERFGQVFGITADDVLLQFSADIVNTFIQEVFGTLLNGAVLAIPSAETRKDPRALLRFADEQYVSIISGFPYLLHELNSIPELPLTLRMVISSGGKLIADTVSDLVSRVPVYNTYGPSAATALATVVCCNSTHPLSTGRYPAGRPAPGIEVRIVDADLNTVPDGEEGRIAIAGPCVADSFTGDHRSDLLASLVTLPDGTRATLTGDIGRMLPDGNLQCLRRASSEVSILGKPVVTGEVERSLTATGEVKECAVVNYTDEKGAAYLVAYVVPASTHFSLSWVKNRIADYLPGYMIPEFFVLLGGLPVNSAGQVNRLALPVVLKDAM